MKAIEIKSLSKTFRSKSFRKVQALTDLCLDVECGEVFGFLGPNGAGKSTTIKCLMGLVKPTAGEAFIAGENARSRKARMRVGYLPENPAFYDYLNAVEYLRFTGRIYGLSGHQLQVEVEKVLHQLDIWEARKRPIRSYSKGMTQRLGLAQALLHDPEVYILDEPMSGLDPLGRMLVKEIILDLKSRGKTVFFSTHISPDVETVCDKVGIINNGCLQRVERVDTILRQGLEGYLVTTSCNESSLLKKQFVESNCLADYLVASSKGGGKVEMVEPQRKRLEEFFLSVIKSS